MRERHGSGGMGERILSLLMLGLFWAAFACLAAGLGLWLWQPDAGATAALLTGGSFGLLAMPLLKLVAVVIASTADRDWLTLGATLTVMIILLALTLRDAAGGR